MVGRTARRHRLPSEAAKRFERGVDPEMTVVALDRAAELLAEYGGGDGRRRRSSTSTTPRPRPADRARPADLPARGSACRTPPAQVVELLDRVGCDGRRRAAARSTVTPPTWRPDLTDPADLVEEVVRLAGYDDVPSVLPTAPPGRGLTDVQRRRRSVGRTLAEAGLRRGAVLPVRRAGGAGRRSACPTTTRAGRSCGVRNPLSEEEPLLRTTLLPGLLAHAARATSAAASATWRCSSTARSSPAASRTPAPAAGRRPAVRTTTSWPRCWARCRSSRGTWPWRWPATASRAAGGAPAGRPAGPTRSRPPGWCAAAVRRRADRAGRGAGAVAPGPLRRAAGRRPGRRPRRRAAPAGAARRWSCRRARRVMELDLDALPAGRGAGRRRRSPASRRC